MRSDCWRSSIDLMEQLYFLKFNGGVANEIESIQDNIDSKSDAAMSTHLSSHFV